MPDAPPSLRIFVNPRRGTPGVTVLPAAGFRRARAEIASWPGYARTPLVPLPGVAAELGLGTLMVKDEAPRFGLGSFKALGGAYAVLGVVAGALARRGDAAAATAAELEAGLYAVAAARVTVCCATDGNHGRSVAWGARRFGAACHIFVHEGVSQGRIDAIAAFGAVIHRVPGTYDAAVREAAATAVREGWLVVSDTSWPGYTEVAREVMQGYRLMADEALDQWTGPPPTHVFIQAGVGGVAAAVSVQMRARLDPAPAVVVVEPDQAACLMASAEVQALNTVGGELDTIMAGLACGVPSLLAWQELERAAAAFVAIPDEAAVEAMRVLAAQGVVSGESGAAGLGALMLICGSGVARAQLGLDATSRVLLFSTEGATDLDVYQALAGA